MSVALRSDVDALTRAVRWNHGAVHFIFGAENFDFAKEFPAVSKWHHKLLERPAIKEVWAERDALLQAQK